MLVDKERGAVVPPSLNVLILNGESSWHIPLAIP